MVGNLYIFNFNSMLKKIIINIVLVGITVFVLDLLIGKNLDYNYFKAVEGENFQITYAIEKTKADVLIIGSSRANHHYIPKMIQDSLNLSCYNAGMDGCVLLYQNAILKSVLKRYTPKVIILDYIGGLEDEELSYDMLSHLTPYYDTHEEIREIVELKSPFEKIKLLSNIYPHNSEVYSILRNTFQSSKRITDNGYKPEEGVWEKEMDTIKTILPYEFDKTILAANKEFLYLAKKSGAKVIVIYSPIYLSFKQKQELDFMKQLCKEQEIPFWDFSKDSMFLNNKKYFKDVKHLNHTGASLYTNIIIKKLKKELQLINQ